MAKKPKTYTHDEEIQITGLIVNEAIKMIDEKIENGKSKCAIISLLAIDLYVLAGRVSAEGLDLEQYLAFMDSLDQTFAEIRKELDGDAKGKD
ncbi:MAG: hypothetical protein DRQ48_01015 [Gammaproteobacteria bacterium]|nr:MAG: hypothetical protein DRQ44_00355 [Gammaproteobacteria bacterium]RKZ72260.1 MAG: hypothetical protein DRQ48_01015 [Gammaproteobacteria bacterium]